MVMVGGTRENRKFQIKEFTRVEMMYSYITIAAVSSITVIVYYLCKMHFFNISSEIRHQVLQKKCGGKERLKRETGKKQREVEIKPLKRNQGYTIVTQ